MLQPIGINDKSFVLIPINDNARADSTGGSHWLIPRIEFLSYFNYFILTCLVSLISLNVMVVPQFVKVVGELQVFTPASFLFIALSCCFTFAALKHFDSALKIS